LTVKWKIGKEDVVIADALQTNKMNHTSKSVYLYARNKYNQTCLCTKLWK